MTSNERHFALLRSLVGAKVSFVTVGSAAQVLAEQRVYEVPDVDILLEEHSVSGLVQWAGEGNVTVWGEQWSTSVELDGKIYLRAMIDGLQLDATFEEPEFSIAELIEGARWIEGIPVCAPGPLRRMATRPRS